MSLGWISPQKISWALFSSDGANGPSGSWNIMWIPSFGQELLISFSLQGHSYHWGSCLSKKYSGFQVEFWHPCSIIVLFWHNFKHNSLASINSLVSNFAQFNWKHRNTLIEHLVILFKNHIRTTLIKQSQRNYCKESSLPWHLHGLVCWLHILNCMHPLKFAI